jgi:hypothetical protein
MKEESKNAQFRKILSKLLHDPSEAPSCVGSSKLIEDKFLVDLYLSLFGVWATKSDVVLDHMESLMKQYGHEDRLSEIREIYNLKLPDGFDVEHEFEILKKMWKR